MTFTARCAKALLTFLERAITGDELATAHWALLDITTGYVEFAFQNSTVMAGNIVCIPVLVFTSVSNARTKLSLERV